ncbi:putative NAD-dependent epimerase/dehydratase family protein [Bradyrhizobium sp. LB1.3]
MRHSPSIVPLDRLDREIYLVLEDFRARAGCSWRETDEQDTDLETIMSDLLSGQYAYPVRIVAVNAIEGWSRDATSEIAERALERGVEIGPALRAFIEANAIRPVAVQLTLPLKGVARPGTLIS